MGPSRRQLAAVLAGFLLLAAAGQATSIAAVAEQTPSPEQLWDAYPLQPGAAGSQPADPAPTPTAAPTRGAGRPASRPNRRDTDGTLAAVILIGAAGLAFGVGLATMVLLRRIRRANPKTTGPPVVGRPVPANERYAPSPRAEAPARDGPEATSEAARVQEPAMPPAERFARRRPWPDDAADVWTCQLEWNAGYRTSTFRAMAAAPGERRRRHQIGESEPLRWLLMGEPEPPTPETAAAVRELMSALTAEGWESIGRAQRWYALRFVWRQEVEPRPLTPLTGRARDA
jgi:hypothetical protein